MHGLVTVAALLLVTLAAFTGWVLFLLASPAAPCRKCHGWGVNPRRRQRRRRRPTCRHCDGTGLRFRPGARHVHHATATLLRSRAAGEHPTPPGKAPPHQP